MASTSKGNYINGEWVQGRGPTFSSNSASHERPVWTGHASTIADVVAAVSAAVAIAPKWSMLDVSVRAAHLRTFVDVLKANKMELAGSISEEIGKPRWEAATEVAAMIGKLEPTELAFRERAAEVCRQVPGGVSRTRFRPHGVVAVIGPYNFPGHMPNGHILPALLAGNAVVFKPSELAPNVAELTVQYWAQAGLPPGALNLVQGDGTAGALLARHADVQGVFFTGSRKVGEAIYDAVGKEKICALEMGGSSPLIVWDAANIDAAVVATIQSAFITSGQRCSAARRLIVPTTEFGQRFLDRLVAVTRNIRIGSPGETPEPYMGPLRLPSMVDHLLGVQDRLLAGGANSLLLSNRMPYGRAFVSPGLLDVSNTHSREDEEVIGPLLQVVRVENFDAAMHEANNTAYGLAAGIFTQNPALYSQFQHGVRAGILNWNQQLTGASAWAPFGGIKHSGNYRPSGYLATDYCVYATGSIEQNELTLPSDLPTGVML